MAPALSSGIRDTLAVLYPQSALPSDATQIKDQIDRWASTMRVKSSVYLWEILSSAVTALAKDLKGQLLELSHRLDLLTRAKLTQGAEKPRLSWLR